MWFWFLSRALAQGVSCNEELTQDLNCNTVDVSLEGELPRGSRPDLTVDGTIELERLPDVLFVGRPAYGNPQSKIEMFKLVDGGKAAVRVPVSLGRSSVSTIEILSGLAVGDKVILSDIAAWDNVKKIELN
mgnify:CR=1 FL=1